MTNAQAQTSLCRIKLVQIYITITKQDGVRPAYKSLKNISKSELRSDKLLRTGEELPDAIKKLLGEENNLKSSVLQTTSHAITQSVNKQTLDKLATSRSYKKVGCLQIRGCSFKRLLERIFDAQYKIR